MIEYSYIVGPVVGGIIGYITNDLAIKMLFRPHTAKYFFGMRLPFTPGIIPKEKERIAIAMGGAISENLMSKEVLERNLLSEEMISKIRLALSDFFDKQFVNTESLQQFLLHYLTEADIVSIVNNLKRELTTQVSQTLSDSQLGNEIADVVIEHVSSKLRIEGLDISIPKMVLNLFGNTLWGALADLIQIPARHFLAKSINNMLIDHGLEIVNNLLSSQIESFLSTSVKVLLEGKRQQVENFCDAVMSLYKKMISDELPKILSTINIPMIIESRINEMDMNETEKLIFQVMDKELKAIVWLGALLGFIMGFVNVFV